MTIYKDRDRSVIKKTLAKFFSRHPQFFSSLGNPENTSFVKMDK